MVIVVLLLILAVLLFGSSAVIGAAGMVFGFFAAFVAFAYTAFYLDVSLPGLIVYSILGFVGFIVVGNFIVWAISAKNPLIEEEQRISIFTPEEKLSRMSRKYVEPEILSPDERDSLERKRYAKHLEEMAKRTN